MRQPGRIPRLQRRVRPAPRPLSAEPAPGHDLIAALAALVDDKSVTPVIDSTYPLQQTTTARGSLEAGGRFGKRIVQAAQ